MCHFLASSVDPYPVSMGKHRFTQSNYYYFNHIQPWSNEAVHVNLEAFISIHPGYTDLVPLCKTAIDLSIYKRKKKQAKLIICCRFLRGLQFF